MIHAQWAFGGEEDGTSDQEQLRKINLCMKSGNGQGLFRHQEGLTGVQNRSFLSHQHRGQPSPYLAGKRERREEET